jgi:hypothetical protein
MTKPLSTVSNNGARTYTDSCNDARTKGGMGRYRASVPHSQYPRLCSISAFCMYVHSRLRSDGTRSTRNGRRSSQRCRRASALGKQSGAGFSYRERRPQLHHVTARAASCRLSPHTLFRLSVAQRTAFSLGFRSQRAKETPCTRQLLSTCNA